MSVALLSKENGRIVMMLSVLVRLNFFASMQDLHEYLLAASPRRCPGIEAMVLFRFCGDFLLYEVGYCFLQQ